MAVLEQMEKQRAYKKAYHKIIAELIKKENGSICLPDKIDAKLQVFTDHIKKP